MCRVFSRSLWDLVPWPGIKPRPPTLGVWSLSHQITREVPKLTLINILTHFISIFNTFLSQHYWYRTLLLLSVRYFTFFHIATLKSCVYLLFMAHLSLEWLQCGISQPCEVSGGRIGQRGSKSWVLAFPDRCLGSTHQTGRMWKVGKILPNEGRIGQNPQWRRTVAVTWESVHSIVVCSNPNSERP